MNKKKQKNTHRYASKVSTTEMQLRYSKPCVANSKSRKEHEVVKFPK